MISLRYEIDIESFGKFMLVLKVFLLSDSRYATHTMGMRRIFGVPGFCSFKIILCDAWFIVCDASCVILQVMRRMTHFVRRISLKKKFITFLGRVLSSWYQSRGLRNLGIQGLMRMPRLKP